jgi:hypothetical protein
MSEQNSPRCAIRVLMFAVVVVAVTFGPSTLGQSSLSKMLPFPRANLCVTEGSLGEVSAQRLSITVPKMRAYATVPTSQDVQARFTYLGPTGGEARLGSGQLRRQFGLKLHAEDACNLVYAMWRIEPESKLVVSVKSNPGQHTSAECGNRGYRNIKPRRSSPVPVLHPSDTHTLRAEMAGEELKVTVDNKVVWEGAVGPEAIAFAGPVGMRSDNAHLEVELSAGRSVGAQSAYTLACRAGAGDTE